MCTLSVAIGFQILPRLDTGSAALAFLRVWQCSRSESGFLWCWQRWPLLLEGVDHCHPFFMQDVPEEGSREACSSWWEVSCRGQVFVQQTKTELSKRHVALGLGSRNPFVHLALSASRYPDKENTIFEENKCEQSQCLKNLYLNATTDVIMERNM